MQGAWCGAISARVMLEVKGLLLRGALLGQM
jgi:hypothetical protein